MSKARGAEEVAAVDEVFRALAHESRRQILMVIQFRGGEMTAGQIADRFACAWPTTTRHLKVLEESRLLVVEKRGRERVYRLAKERLLSVTDGWRGLHLAPISEYRQIFSPRADSFGVALSQNTRDLRNVIEIMCDPGCQKLPKRHTPKSRMRAGPSEIGIGEFHRPQRRDALFASVRKRDKQLARRFALALAELRFAVERIENKRFAVIQNAARARNPVGVFAMDEMADHAKRTPRSGAFISVPGRVRESFEQRTQHRGCSHK